MTCFSEVYLFNFLKKISSGKNNGVKRGKNK